MLLFRPFVWGPQFNEHNLMEARSYLLFTVRQQHAFQAAQSSAPIFNAAMRPLIMRGFK